MTLQEPPYVPRELQAGASLETPPEDLAPFTLLAPLAIRGKYYDPSNHAMHIFKQYIQQLTGGELPRHISGNIAVGLVVGAIDQVKPKRTGLYTIEGEGRGITFHDPTALYCRWSELENRVGRKKQVAMRRLIENRGNTELHYKYLSKYVEHVESTSTS